MIPLLARKLFWIEPVRPFACICVLRGSGVVRVVCVCVCVSVRVVHFAQMCIYRVILCVFSDVALLMCYFILFSRFVAALFCPRGVTSCVSETRVAKCTPVLAHRSLSDVQFSSFKFLSTLQLPSTHEHRLWAQFTPVWQFWVINFHFFHVSGPVNPIASCNWRRRLLFFYFAKGNVACGPSRSVRPTTWKHVHRGTFRCLA